MQPKEFFGWLCKSQQDATFCLFLIRNLFFLRDKNLSHSQSLIKNTYFPKIKFKVVHPGEDPLDAPMLVKNCEIQIAGSGDGRLNVSSMRDSIEEKNQRFLIYIIPKNIMR